MYRKYKKSELHEMVRLGVAIDATNFKEMPEHVSQEGYCQGIYGCSGAVFKGDSGQIYVITKRNSLLARYA